MALESNNFDAFENQLTRINLSYCKNKTVSKLKFYCISIEILDFLIGKRDKKTRYR